MRPDAHLSIVPAEVRERSIARHGGLRLDSGRTYVLAGGMGLPRLWPRVILAALEGFEKAIAQSAAPSGERLDLGVRAAQESLRSACDALIERMLPDATLLALTVDHDDLHAVSVGPGRIYVHRRGTPHRLTPREDPSEGLLRGAPAKCAYPIEPGDVILAGSVSAFSMRAIAKLASVLEADDEAQPSVLATLLTEPASRAHVGAVALAARVR